MSAKRDCAKRRAWFVEHFIPVSGRLMEKIRREAREHLSTDGYHYGEMVASIVNRGLINDERFFESNERSEVVWDACDDVPIHGERRSKIAAVCKYRRNVKRREAWREKECAGVERGDAAA